MSDSGNISQDLFEDSGLSHSSNLDESWRGVTLKELKLRKGKAFVYPEVHPSSSHTVLFRLPLNNGEIPKPYPEKTIDFWDENHVRLPHSPRSLYPSSDTELKPRWNLVCEALERPITCSEELEKAIYSYNSRNNQKLALSALHTFFSKSLDEGEAEYFFEFILPGIIQLALALPRKIRSGIPLLRKHTAKSVSLSQDQVSSLVANAFLCTFPRRNSSNHYNPYPRINFNGLFQRGDVKCVPEKIKCFVNYFRRVIGRTPEGIITYSRHYIQPDRLPNWEESKSLLTKLHINSQGTIEDEGCGMMEIDFANKFVGGGVLGRGAVQEEIKFLICPELIVSKLLTECLDSSEALIVTGCERFNQYVGYGDTFTWAGDFVDSSERDRFKRKFCSVAAIDATHYNNTEQQYTPSSMKRELNKAFVGFSFGSKEGWNINIATGNWGCGAFKGEPRLKALIQLMAAAVAHRNVAYFTFQNDELRDSIYDMHTFLVKEKITVGHLWKLMTKYSEYRKQENIELYDFIYNMINKEDIFLQKNNSSKTNKPTSDGASSSCNTSNMPKPVQSSTKNVSLQKKSDSQDMELTEDEIALAVECAEEIENSTVPNVSNEPVPAESYSIKTEEGKKRGIEIEKQRWKTYEIAKKELSSSESVLPDNILNNNSNEMNTGSLQKPAVKRKISDYFKSYSDK